MKIFKKKKKFKMERCISRDWQLKLMYGVSVGVNIKNKIEYGWIMWKAQSRVGRQVKCNWTKKGNEGPLLGLVYRNTYTERDRRTRHDIKKTFVFPINHKFLHFLPQISPTPTTHTLINILFYSFKTYILDFLI